MNIFKKPYSWAITFSVLMAAFTADVILDSFVIKKSYQVVANAQTLTQASSGTATEDSYKSDTLNVKLNQYRQNDTDIYVADVTLSGENSIKTAFADSTYGKNITEKTSQIAEENNAVLAINGDYYSARSGYVIRNGVLYRSSSAGSNQDDLVIYSDGSFGIINEAEVTADELLKNGAQQVLSFGPALIKDGSISVTESTEVDKAMRSNPRTAICITNDNHILMVVADGRTSKSTGLSLYELAQFLQTLNVKYAYNLDGGGSSTMYFNGSVINNPTTNGKTISERKVSDIIYVN